MKKKFFIQKLHGSVVRVFFLYILALLRFQRHLQFYKCTRVHFDPLIDAARYFLQKSVGTCVEKLLV